MNTSANNGKKKRQLFRRSHRWVGVSIVVFVILLAVTGILLNHSVDFALDRKHVTWNWLLDAYGIEVPEPTASFAVDDHRATLLGDHLYFNEHEIDASVASLAGIVRVDPLLLVASGGSVYLYTPNGDLVEAMDLSARLAGDIDAIGTTGGLAVVRSHGIQLRSDPDIATFEPWEGAAAEVNWSTESSPAADELDALALAYRGRGITIERVLLDLHSGRIFSVAGKVILDAVGILMIVMSVTGLFLSRARNRRQNGTKRGLRSR